MSKLPAGLDPNALVDPNMDQQSMRELARLLMSDLIDFSSPEMLQRGVEIYSDPEHVFRATVSAMRVWQTHYAKDPNEPPTMENLRRMGIVLMIFLGFLDLTPKIIEELKPMPSLLEDLKSRFGVPYVH